jgi:uncharacterized iron-regulated membrane protein
MAVTLRRLLLKTHLYLALAAAPVLVVLGLTGSVIAFENDIPHWLHPSLFYVRPGPAARPEEELIRDVDQRFAPARVQSAQILRGANLARVFQLPGEVSVFVNPYDGTILGTTRDGFPSDRIIQYIHQMHLRLVPDPPSMPRLAATGKVVVSDAGFVLCLLVPTGLVLFWRTRRATVRWRAPWFRVCFDLHHVVGAGAALLLLLAAMTGVLIGFPSGERIIYVATGSGSPRPLPPPRSTPGAGRAPLGIDQALAVARTAIPDAVVTGYSLPRQPTGAFIVLLRVPGETSETVHSSVAVDQYSGAVLQTRDFRTDSAGYYWIRFNRSLHTGDVWGTPTHVVAAASSVLLVVMVLTGLVIWWRKLAV